jgi:hypothetical protein
LSSTLDRAQHAHIRKAAAQNAGHGALDLAFGSFRVLIEESLGRHKDAVDAKSALCSAFLDESLLERVQLGGCPNSLERGDVLALDRFHGCDAGTDRAPICDYSAGSALAEAATEFRTVQRQVVA